MYTKLFQSIVTSTIWTEDDKTRIVWITMLAMSDKNGEVMGSIPGLARLANVSIEECERAVNRLESEDKYSRTPDHEGRRIAKIEGGWEILNHAKYRRMASKEEAKEKAAERQRRYRERNAPVTHRNAFDGESNASVTQDRDIADTEADTKAVHKETKSKGTLEDLQAFAREIGLPESDGESMFHHWEGNGWKNGTTPVKDWKASIRKWKLNKWLPSQKMTQNGQKKIDRRNML